MSIFGHDKTEMTNTESFKKEKFCERCKEKINI